MRNILTARFFLLIVSMIMISNAFGQEKPSIKGVEHVRVVWMKDPAHEAVVTWSTWEAGKQHTVYYDVATHGKNIKAYRNKAKTFLDGQFTGAGGDATVAAPAYYHHVHLKGLTPATTYYLVVASDNNISREYHFITAPDDDRPITILHGGDSRLGGKNEVGGDPSAQTDRAKMNLRIASLAEENPEIIALAHGGDYCMKAELGHIEPWLEDFDFVTSKSGRLLPLIPTRGNHDVDKGFEELFAWPGLDNEYYYTTRLSREVALVTLNTEISMGGNQRDWLKEQLAALRPANRWLFVQYHRPAYTSVKNPQRSANQRQYWVPLFEEYDVDLVCESDDHALKRTLPISGDKPDMENGIVYIGDGGLGVPQRTPDPARWYLQKPGFATSAHHVFMLEFGAENIRVRAFSMDGNILDNFKLDLKGMLVK